MSRSRVVRIAAVGLVGLTAGAAAWRGLAPIEPFLEVTTRLVMRTAADEIWGVGVTVRGGETIQEIRVEPVSGPVHVVDASRGGLASGVSTMFRVQVDGNRVQGAAVRVVQKGRVERVYPAPLEESP